VVGGRVVLRGGVLGWLLGCDGGGPPPPHDSRSGDRRYILPRRSDPLTDKRWG